MTTNGVRAPQQQKQQQQWPEEEEENDATRSWRVTGELEGGRWEKEASVSPAGEDAVAASLSDDSESLSFSLAEKRAEELQRKWAAIERLPTADRLRTSLLSTRSAVPGAGGGGDGGGGINGDVNEGDGAASAFEVVDVRRLGAAERRAEVQRLVADVKHDHVRMLMKQRERMDRVGVRAPTVEVLLRDVCVEAECQVVAGKPLPTLWNSALSKFSLLAAKLGSSRHRAKIQILKNVSGIIKPSRITLLLGPPRCGKTTLLKALAGKLNKGLKETGEIEYNGVKLDEFVPAKTSA